MLIQRLAEYAIAPQWPRRVPFIRLVCQRITEARAVVMRRDAQSMVEYALLLMLIGGVVLVILILLGDQVHNVFNNVSCAIGKLGGSCAPPED